MNWPRCPTSSSTKRNVKFIAEIGDNKGCMELKGANRAHVGSALPDRWEITKDHELIAKQWGIDPDKDIACTHKAAA